MLKQRITARLLVFVAIFAAFFTAAGVQPAQATPYTHQPSISVSTNTPVAGTTITITGSSFVGGERVTLTLKVGTTTYAIGSVGTGPKGGFSLSYTIPAGARGPATITGVGATGDTASVNITILAPPPVLTLSSSTVNVGGSVTVSGSGYAANESVTIKLSLNSTVYTLGAVSSTGSSGTFSKAVTIPTNATAGNGVVTGLGSTNDTASANITVTAPTITLSKSTVAAGTTVTVTGSNFAKNETVSLVLQFTSKSFGLGSTSSNGNGGFSKVVTIPNNIKGSGKIVATGSTGDTASANITVTSLNIFAQQVGKITNLRSGDAIGLYAAAAIALGSLVGGAFLFRTRRS